MSRQCRNPKFQNKIASTTSAGLLSALGWITSNLDYTCYNGSHAKKLQQPQAAVKPLHFHVHGVF